MTKRPAAGLAGADGASMARAVAELVESDSTARGARLLRRYAPGFAGRMRRRAVRMDACGTGGGFTLLRDGEAVGCRQDRCRDRGCPRCWHLTVSRHEPTVRAVLDAAVAEGYGVAFVTLTRKADDLDLANPRDTIATMRAAWRRLRQRMRRDQQLAGGWTRLETTWNGKRNRLRCHAHFHVVALTAPGVDADAVGERMARRWLEAVRDEGGAAVERAQDVQLVRPGDDGEVDSGKLRRYILKYTLKPSELTDPAAWGLQAYALHGARLFQSWGDTHGASRSTSPLAEIARRVAAEQDEERARYSVERLSAADVRAIPVGDLRAVVELGRQDCPLFRAWQLAGECLERWERNRGAFDLMDLRDALAACPVTPLTRFLSGLAASVVAEAQLSEQAQDGNPDNQQSEQADRRNQGDARPREFGAVVAPVAVAVAAQDATGGVQDSERNQQRSDCWPRSRADSDQYSAHALRSYQDRSGPRSTWVKPSAL